jgi:hypothetical protein
MNWLRSCSVNIGGAGAVSYDGGSETGFRIRFQMWTDVQQAKNLADITITNPLASYARSVAKRHSEFEEVTVSFGYQGAMQTVFIGEITQAMYGRENPTDTFLRIVARSGDKAYQYAHINKTLDANSTGQDMFDELAKTFQEHGIGKGFVSSKLSEVKIPRPYPMSGQSRDYMRSLAKMLGGQWSIQDKDLTLMKPGESNGGAIEINRGTGMIGMPEQQDEYILVRHLIDPRLRVLTDIHLNEADIQVAFWDPSIGGTGGFPNRQDRPPGQPFMPDITADGIYTIHRIEFTGDTRGTPWYQDLYCYPKGAAVPGSLSVYSDMAG